MMESYLGLAPAKINLTLKITGKRDDGYHLMDSLVVFAELADIVHLNLSDSDSLAIKGPLTEALKETPPEENIVIRALQAYRDHTGWAQRFGISLEKIIPVAAGIGGGASDAAAMLKTLNKICPDPLDEQTLITLGLELGADVPVCLGGQDHHLWHMHGIGEFLDPVDYHPSLDFGLILMNPGISVPTKSIFSALKPEAFSNISSSKDRYSSSPIQISEITNWLKDGNSLAEPASHLHQEIAIAIETMSALQHFQGFLCSGMSGSGATVFSLFETVAEARLAEKELRHQTHWLWSGGVYKSQSNFAKTVKRS
jgi:4-diphosphocytidyl-2-C-methyl-D-erythritol kinase